MHLGDYSARTEPEDSHQLQPALWPRRPGVQVSLHWLYSVWRCATCWPSKRKIMSFSSFEAKVHILMVCMVLHCVKLYQAVYLVSMWCLGIKPTTFVPLRLCAVSGLPTELEMICLFLCSDYYSKCTKGSPESILHHESTVDLWFGVCRLFPVRAILSLSVCFLCLCWQVWGTLLYRQSATGSVTVSPPPR